MENMLNYYYGINVIDIKKYDNYYLVKTEDDIYILNEIYDEDALKEIIDYLNNTNILYHLLLLNKDNEIAFVYDNKKYSLFKVRNNQSNISIFDFANLSCNGKCNWGKLWSKRVDYYLEQIKEIVSSNEIKYVMDYYISLAEIAISYFNNLQELYNEKNLYYSISHRYISSPLNSYDYFNPANMCKDLSVRDIAEYIKMSFFDDILTNNEVLNLIDKITLNEEMANYLLVRLIYPSYFFYLFDKYIENREVDKKIYTYIKKSRDFETLLSLIYNKLKINFNIRAFIYFFKSEY